MEEARLTSFRTPFESYKTIAAAPRKVTVSKSTATSSLNDIFTETDCIIENKFDKLIIQFKTKNLSFYRDYFIACIIEDRGSRQPAKSAPTPSSQV